MLRVRTWADVNGWHARVRADAGTADAAVMEGAARAAIAAAQLDVVGGPPAVRAVRGPIFEDGDVYVTFRELPPVGTVSAHETGDGRPCPISGCARAAVGTHCPNCGAPIVDLDALEG